MASPTAFDFRSARAGDALALARLEQLLSDGYGEFMWSMLQEYYPDKTLLEIGEMRFSNSIGVASYRNCIVAERDGEINGMIFFYRSPQRGTDMERLRHPVTNPLHFPEVAGTLHISSVGVFPDYRNLGIGTTLLRHAKSSVQAPDVEQASLVVLSSNTGARKLYEREGFTETARQAIIPHPMIRAEGDAIYMTSSIE